MLEKTTLGPLTVSRMAMGAMLYGTRIDRETSYALMDRFVAEGGNFIDTANNYAFWIEGGHAGDSERLLGDWMAARGNRDSLVIATKCGARPLHEGAALEASEGLSRQVILTNVDQSLQTLKTDRIDLLYAHIDDRTVPLEETLSAFDEVVRAGKVRAIGCSNHMSWRIEAARRIARERGFAPYVCVQQRHTYYQARWHADFGFRSVMGDRGGWGLEEGTTDEHLDYARVHSDFRIVAYSPSIGGGYARPDELREQFRTPDNEKRRAVLKAVAGEIGGTPNQVVLKWMMASNPSIIPLFAVSSLAQLAENIGAATLALTPEHIVRLDAAI